MFFIPKKKLVLHCYTNQPALPELAPVAKANNFFPDWWKKLPKDVLRSDSIAKLPTMKSCQGIIDLYSKGLILPMWSELNLQIGAAGTDMYKYEFINEFASLAIHAADQRGNYLPNTEYQHFKLNSPWVFHCEEPVNFMFMEPTWSLEDLSCLKILPGVLNYKYQHMTNVNLMCIRKPEAYQINIPFLEPIAHIIPLDSREICLKVEYNPHKYSHFLDFSRSRANHNYKIVKKIKKANEQKRCPFGFGR